jgi:hypothetical protein
LFEFKIINVWHYIKFLNLSNDYLDKFLQLTYKKIMQKFLVKQPAKRNVSALVAAGIIIIGGYVMRRLRNKVAAKNMQEKLIPG